MIAFANHHLLPQIDIAIKRGRIGQHIFTSVTGERSRKIVEDDKKILEISEMQTKRIKKEFEDINYYLEHGDFPSGVSKKLTSAIEDLN